MTTTQLNQLGVGGNTNIRTVVYQAKKLLLEQESIEVYSGTYGAQVVAQACEQLVRLNYVTITDVRSETNILEGNRRIKFVMRLKKTSNFQKLYDENEANQKAKQEERVKQNPTLTPTPKN